MSERFILKCSGLAVALALLGCGNSPITPGQDGSIAADASTVDGRFADTRMADARIPDVAPRPDTGPIHIGDSGLPMLPELTRVTFTPREDSVGIDFDPVDDAVDYRVYELPVNHSDIGVHADGSITIHNAVYHCSGLRQTYDLENDLNMGAAGLFLENGPFNWKARIGANPRVGYVYAMPGDGRVPVYVVAGYPGANEVGWRESRYKLYVTSQTDRQMYIDHGWRDEGIAFYVPSAAGSTTQTIYTSEHDETWNQQSWPHRTRYYFAPTDMAMHTTDTVTPTAAFQVLTAAGTDTEPLYAVFYGVDEQAHTELAAGNERFHRAAYQGNGPLWHLEWPGITQQTTLVVEALADGCPFQGLLSPQHLAAMDHQVWYTLADLQAASSTGEVFVNGQFDTTNLAPVPIARSFIQVSPQPPGNGDWDWYQDFHAAMDLTSATEIPGCQEAGGPGYNCDHWQTADLDLSVYRIEKLPMLMFTFGTIHGQMWEAFDDVARDVTGKVRIGSRQMGSISTDENQYFHATMSVNIVSTDRRYPQLIVSDQAAPVQAAFNNANQNTVLIQAIQGPATHVETQIFHGLINNAQWDVNNQTTAHILAASSFQDNSGGGSPPTPTEPVLEHAGVDRMTRFDAYISSRKLYFFLDGTPSACVRFPAGFSISGPVSMTVGDVLYHEGAPDPVCAGPRPFSFLNAHQCSETERHFDDLGFKNNAVITQTDQFTADPASFGWDERRLPCSDY